MRVGEDPANANPANAGGALFAVIAAAAVLTTA